jgi:integrase
MSLTVPSPAAESPPGRSTATDLSAHNREDISLAEIIGQLQSDQNLDPDRQRAMISALRTIARLLEADPAAIPADPRSLRQRLGTVSPVIHRISRRRFDNMRSLTLAALRRVGVRNLPGRAREPLTSDWEALREHLSDAKARIGLSRFLHYCSAKQIAPEAVKETVFTTFRQDLDNSLVRQPQRLYRTTCVQWNRVAKTIALWPSLLVPIPSASRRYALSWDSFPLTFHSDAQAFLHRLGNQDPFSDSYAVPAKPSTVEMRRKQILQIATALVDSGIPAADITSLAVLVKAENVRRALRVLRNRFDGKPSKYLHQQALLLKTIARHWVRATREQVDDIGEICRRLAVENTGMTERNRARLRQFDNPVNVATLINLPARVFAEMQRSDSGKREDALRVMLALAVELLLVAPMRIGNLAGLDITRHFVRTGHGRSGTVHLVIPAAETKNNAAYELELPKESATLLKTYVATYHRRLSAEPSSWLFPGLQGGRRVTTTFSSAISAFVQRETGIRMNVHLFRHLAAKLHLETYPEDIETARRILGHQSVTTTLRSYAETKTAAAFRRYDNLIAGLRGTAGIMRGTRFGTSGR